MVEALRENWKKENTDLLKNDSMAEGNSRFVSIQIRVQDTGVGISKEGLSKLFIDFNKLDENSQRNRQGTGLGLSICKKFIELMGGSVDVQSEPG